MFSNALRSQARLGLRTASRVAAAPASRSLSALAVISRRAVLPAASSTSSMLATSRSFSRSAAVLFGAERQNNPPNSSVFVGNLPWSATREELIELFQEFGEVKNVRIQTHADGRPRGFGHVEFANKPDAVACVTSGSEEPLHFAGRDLILDYAKDKPMTSTEIDPSNRLYFRSFSDGESALREILDKHANNVVSIYFLKDGNTGEQLPNGFVEFNNIDTATEALNALNGTQTPSGESLFLQYARAKRDRNDRPKGQGFTGSRSRSGEYRNNNREAYTSRSWDRGSRDRN